MAESSGWTVMESVDAMSDVVIVWSQPALFDPLYCVAC